MKRKNHKYPITFGLFAFFITLFLAFLIESPYPILASLFVGFLILELSYYYYFNKQKKHNNL
ncbi:hypothetical protein [Alkalibacillus haloalkaliphilus]|uniref:Uncharacterized protein n=1 Tax=Alkalibacillus haloalkaliphilus TaxID=94136 RepID=A0A511W0N8_9BACI|nr:hypothetical protein [Alkalibacillus haloalkaliphilus]GEN44635.1 hypothetical protein AHA02nite_04110 [Alkalibacillus haloalkaliphilus]